MFKKISLILILPLILAKPFLTKLFVKIFFEIFSDTKMKINFIALYFEIK